MRCASCRAELREGSKFCDECGAPVSAQCPSCGAENRPGAKFCSECGTKLAAGAPTAPPGQPTPSPPPQPAPSTASAERRQVTVMFSDLVGSTALSARMDPEDLREIISAYQKCVAETVRRFDGFIAKYLGDGVLVYFGYPQAHEDDAERAVRAGLELTAAVGRLNARASLQTRVGIATGVVVVGDLVDAGGSQERGIIGETPNLAARLQGLARPNMVVIAESTRKLLGNLFELEELAVKELKGIAGSVRVWAVLRASSVESRFEALHASGLTALVGREARCVCTAIGRQAAADRRHPQCPQRELRGLRARLARGRICRRPERTAGDAVSRDRARPA